jgi:hypothetical protein
LLLRGIAFIFLAAALFIAIAWTAWVLTLLAGVLPALWVDAMVRQRRHAVLKEQVAHEPMYRQLFEQYPHVRLTLNAEP